MRGERGLLPLRPQVFHLKGIQIHLVVVARALVAGALVVGLVAAVPAGVLVVAGPVVVILVMKIWMRNPKLPRVH
jgi:hypothetical protein